MKKTKLVIFKVHGKPVEEIEGDCITLDQMDIMKSQIAIMHGVSYDDVDIDTSDMMMPEFSATACVTDSGDLLFRSNSPYASWRFGDGVTPALDITKDELFDEFLFLLNEKEFEEAITFS